MDLLLFAYIIKRFSGNWRAQAPAAILHAVTADHGPMQEHFREHGEEPPAAAVGLPEIEAAMAAGGQRWVGASWKDDPDLKRARIQVETEALDAMHDAEIAALIDEDIRRLDDLALLDGAPGRASRSDAARAIQRGLIASGVRAEHPLRKAARRVYDREVGRDDASPGGSERPSRR